MAKAISDRRLKAIVESEIRSAMGEISGELAENRASSLDYYRGEPIGKLAVENPDKSSVVVSTVRDTVTWIHPQLMRTFAKADSVATFEPVGPEDEDAARQETAAINHIFWRENEGFLILYTWIQDALLQKNGIVKFWMDHSDEKAREEYDGLNWQAIIQMLSDDEFRITEFEPSEIRSMDGSPLFHAVFERNRKLRQIKVENIPPEEFLISPDARSLDIQKNKPRFVAHYTEKTPSELLDMGFSKSDIEDMKKGSENWDDYNAERLARYHLSDEEIFEHDAGESHESQRKIKLCEAYMNLDKNGDGYAELLRIWKAGDFIDSEEADCIPFACLSPYVMSHKFFGMSVYDLVKDLQEIQSTILRNVLDNMYQTNNSRPVVNERVDIDSLLTSRPGAPIYVDGVEPTGDSVMPYAPQPIWKDGVTVMEYIDTIRKDRTGIGDETMGLDPNTLANANTGVMLQAIEAAKGKIELIARIFAETGIKWLFRGLHELARKSYDIPLRYKLRNNYVSVNPTEWRERTNMTVNVGVATGDQQRELFALTQIGQIQEKMASGGLMGVTVLPSHLYNTGKRLAECLGEKDGDAFFFNPELLQDPQVQQMIQAQMPQQGPDPQTQALEMNAKVEQGKAQIAAQKMQLEHQTKIAELQLKAEEMTVKAQVDKMKQDLQLLQAESKNQTALERVRHDAAATDVKNAIAAMEAEYGRRADLLKAEIEKYKAELQSSTALEVKLMEVLNQERQSAEQAREKVSESNQDVQKIIAGLNQKLMDIEAKASKPKVIKRDKTGRPISVGDLPVLYNTDGTVKQIG